MYEYLYPKPSVTATVALLYPYKDAEFEVVAIIRKNDPYKGKLCFPGGFLNVDKETVEDAAVREIEEETGIKIDKTRLLHIDIRSAPDRDPREHIIDIGYLVFITKKERDKAQANDDAEKIVYFKMEDYGVETPDMAFDHSELYNKIKARFWRCSFVGKMLEDHKSG